MNVLLAILLLIVSVVVFLYFILSLFPNLFLSLADEGDKMGDRGLKKKLTGEGYAIVYEPSDTIRTYVPQYVIYDKNGEKTFLLKKAMPYGEMRYELSLFDSQNKVFRVLDVDDVSEGVYGTEISLPAHTSYVSLRLKEVDEEKIENSVSYYLSLGKFVAYVFLSLLAFAIEAVVGKICYAMMNNYPNMETILKDPMSNAVLFFFALVGTAMYLYSMFITMKAKIVSSDNKTAKGGK